MMTTTRTGSVATLTNGTTTEIMDGSSVATSATQNHSSRIPGRRAHSTNDHSRNASSSCEPLSTAYASTVRSTEGSTRATSIAVGPRRFFRSRRIVKGETDRPELREKDPMDKWVLMIPILGILVGFAAIGIMTWDGLRSVANHTYCHVFTDDFSGGFNQTIWTTELEVGGYGSVPLRPHPGGTAD